MPAGWASPTAFTIRPITAAPSALASPTTRRPSPLIPSSLGGNVKDHVTMGVLPSFWFWPTQVAATVALRGLGKPKSRLSCATHSASPSPSLTNPPAPLNGPRQGNLWVIDELQPAFSVRNRRNFRQVESKDLCWSSPP